MEHWQMSMGIRGPPLNYIIWHVYGLKILKLYDLLKMSAYDIVPCGHLCYTLAWHMASCYL
jgi:hypothetical protein